MVKLVTLVLATLYFSDWAQAQTQAQSIVLTWEDGATIQLVQGPDGPIVSPAEPISGGITGNSPDVEVSYTSWRATDFRMQSKSWTIAIDPKACGGSTNIVIEPTALSAPELFTSFRSRAHV